MIRANNLWFGLVSLLAAVTMGALATESVPLPAGLQVPPLALTAVLLVVASLPVLLANWRLTLGAFLGWLVIEDLVRKLAGNDLRVYFVKDLIFVVLIAGLVMDPDARLAWKNATGRARMWLYALIAWAVIMSVPTAFQDWRVPVIGLRLDFLYVPLVIVG